MNGRAVATIRWGRLGAVAGAECESMSYGYGPGYYVPQGPVVPREHPSASSALLLGIAGNFCLGALTGVPAILLGRSVVQAIEREPGRWKGRGTATLAIVLGWISVFETAFVVTLVSAHGYVSGALGIVAGLLGLVLVALSSLGKVPLVGLKKARLAIGVPFAGVLLGGAFGLSAAFAKSAETARLCDDARAAYPVSLKKEDFAAARQNIAAIQSDCRSSDDTAAMGREVDAKAAAVTKRRSKKRRTARRTSPPRKRRTPWRRSRRGARRSRAR